MLQSKGDGSRLFHSEPEPDADLTGRSPLDDLRRRGGGARLFDRGTMGDVTIERLGEPGLVVGVNLRVVAAAGHGDVGQALIYERFAGAIQIDVHEQAGRLSLTAVARHGVAVIDMGVGADVQVDGSA
jgi:hypothetical protein